MKTKVFNLLLIISSLFGYLEWGGDNHSFLFQVEAELFSKLFTEPSSVLHPFTILPIVGQLLLLLTLFQKLPNRILIYIGIVFLGILFGFMLIVGVISFNSKIIISTMPFLVIAILSILHFRKMKNN